MHRLWLILAICALGVYFGWRDRPIAQPPGVRAAANPLQRPIHGAVPVFHKDRYEIKALAEFMIEARVLSKAIYRFDAGADLSPTDMVLGWGPMSDNAVLDHIAIDQRRRFYYWSTAVFPIPRRDIEIHSANMHLIPATRAIANQVSTVRAGQIVRLRGFLVEARRNDGWQWRSSLTREDTGDGACELIWVEALTAL